MPARSRLVLVPGLLCDDVVWSHQVAALGKEYDVHVADVTGFSSITAMARAILAEVEGNFSAAGHSMGARVVLEMFRLAPERIERVALLDTGVHPMAEGEPARRAVLVDLGVRQGMRAVAEAWLPPMVKEGALTRQPALRETLTAMVERMNTDIHRNQISALLDRPDATPLLAKLTCPVLVGVGDSDVWSPPAQHRKIADAIPHARYVVFPDSGHMAPMEAPDAVTAAIGEWMRVPIDELDSGLRRAIEADCARVVNRFALLNDAHDHDALAGLFTTGGRFARPTDPDNPVIGREAIRSFFQGRPKRRTRHVMSNIVVEVRSSALAHVQSYVTLYSGERGETVLVGEFADVLTVDASGTWRIAERLGTLAFSY